MSRRPNHRIDGHRRTGSGRVVGCVCGWSPRTPPESARQARFDYSEHLDDVFYRANAEAAIAARAKRTFNEALAGAFFAFPAYAEAENVAVLVGMSRGKRYAGIVINRGGDREKQREMIERVFRALDAETEEAAGEALCNR